MSDAELSDIADEDDLVRRHEFSDGEAAPTGNDDGDVNVSGGEVREGDGNDNDKKTDPTKPKSTRKYYVLNSERLKGPKGVHTIEKLFEGFKFKGKGHEKEDLDGVMKRLEHWAFRIYPKLDFDDFLAKCEDLGSKKDLHVHLKKYRLGMITADDIMHDQDVIIDQEDDEDNPAGVNDRQAEEAANDDAFDRLIAESRERDTAAANTQIDPMEDINDDEFERLMVENVDAVEQADIQSQMEAV